MKCPTCKGKGFLRTLQPCDPDRVVFHDILGGVSAVRVVGEIVAVRCRNCGGRGKVRAEEIQPTPATIDLREKAKPLKEWLDEILDHGYNEE
jgi:hypothetical protein